jgi:hypothetical protein
MKTKIIGTIAILLLNFGFIVAQQTFAPFFKTSNQDNAITVLVDEVVAGLEDKNFTVVGEYKPMQSDDMFIICFTRDDLQKASLSFEDRGALASVLKIGFQKTSEGITVSLQNPMYMFYAYFRNDIDKQMGKLLIIDADAKLVLSDLFGALSPFGGELEATQLIKYHYKMMMPYFDDPVELEAYDSFEQGLAHIQRKLAISTDVKMVYKQIYAEQEIAVFGLALTNTEEGESHFLPIIGESHLAALPYDIILQGKEVTMLHGKYRIALYWPELTMGTFMKIMSTPGDIEDAFEEITKK